MRPTTLTQGAASNYKNLPPDKAKPVNREALGRSRGGFTTKIHLVADRRCRPLAVLTTEGQRHDSIAFDQVLGKLVVDRLGLGRPRTRPDWVLADKAYSSAPIRQALADRKIKAAIPIKDDHAQARQRKGSAGGRPPTFDKDRYRERNTVERAVNKLRGCRATASRYDKRDYIYRGTIAVTSLRIWLRDLAATSLSDRP